MRQVLSVVTAFITICSAETAVFAQASLSDPEAYCKAVGSIDEPDSRYQGPAVTPTMARAFNTTVAALEIDQGGGKKLSRLEWRCMDGVVLACVTLNSPVCGKHSLAINEPMREFCRQSPNQNIPAAVAGRAPVEWKCAGATPVIGRVFGKLDSRGFDEGAWKRVAGPAVADTSSSAECKISNDGNDRGEIKWNGECKDGFASGTGVARWFKEGLLNYEQEYVRTNGLIRVKGEPQVDRQVIDKNIKITMGSCDPSIGYRGVRVDASPELALYNRNVSAYIVNMRAQVFAWEKCPAGNRYDNVDINVYVNGREAIHARSYGQVPGPTAPERTVWQEYNNQPFAQRIMTYDDAFRRASYERQAESQRRVQEEARRQAAAEQQRLAQAKQAVRGKFTADFSVTEFVRNDIFASNPFIYKTKVVGISAQFVRMVAEDEAVFRSGDQYLIIDRVPATRFSGSPQVVLAIKGAGTKQTSALGAPLTLPSGSFVGAFSCRMANCTDFYD
jgi:hypothetical protein